VYGRCARANTPLSAGSHFCFANIEIFLQFDTFLTLRIFHFLIKKFHRTIASRFPGEIYDRKYA